MDNETKKSIERVIAYLFEDEQRNWRDREQPENHIYHDVVRLKELLISLGA